MLFSDEKVDENWGQLETTGDAMGGAKLGALAGAFCSNQR